MARAQTALEISRMEEEDMRADWQRQRRNVSDAPRLLSLEEFRAQQARRGNQEGHNHD